MNFLAWLFGLGALAVIFPLLFHLIRRQPKKKQQFSSLMFVKPSPPKLTKRSRLDNWILFLIRSLAIVLLAIAFMRPYFPQVIQLAQLPGRRVAIVVDTSASMRRDNLWQNTIDEVHQVLKQLDSQDQVALFSFDREIKSHVEFDNDLNSQHNRELVKKEIQSLQPSWHSTDLGKALVSVADQLDELVDRDSASQNEISMASQIILISDFPQSASTRLLDQYAWPDSVSVDVRQIHPSNSTNASLQIVSSKEEADANDIPKVRVTNSKNSEVEQFQVTWTNAEGRTSDRVNYYVPAGSSRVLPIPRPANFDTDRLVLTGDQSDFDNEIFIASPIQAEITVGYLGEDQNENQSDAVGLRYYLSRAFSGLSTRKVNVDSDLDSLKRLAGIRDVSPALTVVARSVDSDELKMLTSTLRLGNNLLIVLQSPEMARSLEPLLGQLEVSEQGSDQRQEYRMFGEIDFSHPLFNPLSGPQFNDFTKIRFWKHRAVTLPPNGVEQIIARFDNDDPALWSIDFDQGKIFVMTSGWAPDESELGLATKFVPLMTELLELSVKQSNLESSLLVGDSITLPEVRSSEGNSVRKIRKPDGIEINLSREQTHFSETDQPGIYTMIDVDSTATPFAVNLNNAESLTAPMDPEQLAVHDVRIGTQPVQQELIERMRREGTTKLEARQKIWKWAIVIILGLLLVETLLASRNRIAIQQAGVTG